MRSLSISLFLSLFVGWGGGEAQAQMVDLGTLGGDFSQAFAVQGGQVVGFAETTLSGQFHAFSVTP